MKGKNIIFVTDRRGNCWICELNTTHNGLIITDADYSVSAGVITLHDPPQVLERVNNAVIREADESEKNLFYAMKENYLKRNGIQYV